MRRRITTIAALAVVGAAMMGAEDPECNNSDKTQREPAPQADPNPKPTRSNRGTVDVTFVVDSSGGRLVNIWWRGNTGNDNPHGIPGGHWDYTDQVQRGKLVSLRTEGELLQGRWATCKLLFDGVQVATAQEDNRGRCHVQELVR